MGNSIAGLLALATLLGTVACGSSDDSEGGIGGRSTGGGTSTGGSATGGTSGSQCSGACPAVDATCTINPPPGSAAPSVLCRCTDALQWCCGDASCFTASGGSGGSGGSNGSGGSGGGACTEDCASQGLECCGGRCVNTGNDILNCGSCGNECGGETPYCGNGTCGTAPCNNEACGATTTCCGSQCCAAGQLCCDVNLGPSVTACYDAVDGTCPVGCPTCDCASAETLVATPSGDVPIYTIREGDVVYSVDHDAIVAVPVLATNRVSVSNHVMVSARMSDGSVVKMSPRHPTAEGKRFDALRAGDRLGDLHVDAIVVEPYSHAYTYDLLPASESGAYFANDVLVGSTLRR